MERLAKKEQIEQETTFWGRVTEERKKDLMQKANVICVTSTREGWGLIVTEANAMGTPAVVYNTDGLRDSVKDGVTGLICEKNDRFSLARNLKLLYLNPKLYSKLRNNAYEWSQTITFDKSYKQVRNVIRDE